MPASPNYPPLLTRWRIVQVDGAECLSGQVFDHPLHPDAREIVAGPVAEWLPFSVRMLDGLVYALGQRQSGNP